MIAAINKIVFSWPNIEFLGLSTWSRNEIFITINLKKLNQSFSSSSLFSSLDEPPPTLMSTNSGLLRGELFPF